ncbi:hypothetical protein [Saccharolobus caldissimus]|uniref:Uncharacterized protein n=1 Tax=Saccharolobus caldissimus TaxID=1702097 RepID=A0AAQ4CR89_9CREN|nr:hypothetical protein [Saccharolobus caldissimus]BDB98320.1 hypothetical protein SACC_13370 [Saccharolobus caldissimus]
MSKTHEMLEDYLNIFLKLVIIGELLNIEINLKDVEKIMENCNNIAVELSKNVFRKKFGGDRSRKLDEAINTVYTKLQAINPNVEVYLNFLRKLNEAITTHEYETIWKNLEEFESYLNSFEGEKKTEKIGSILYTITELKIALIDYLSSIRGDSSEAFLISRNEGFSLILGDKIYQLKINGLSDEEKRSKDAFRLEKALELLLKEEEKIRGEGILGEIFTISKIKEKEKVVNAIISFADAKRVLDIKRFTDVKVKLLKKTEDVCIFLPEGEKESLYAMIPCNIELEAEKEYIFKGGNTFEKLTQP